MNKIIFISILIFVLGIYFFSKKKKKISKTYRPSFLVHVPVFHYMVLWYQKVNENCMQQGEYKIFYIKKDADEFFEAKIKDGFDVDIVPIETDQKIWIDVFEKVA